MDSYRGMQNKMKEDYNKNRAQAAVSRFMSVYGGALMLTYGVSAK